MKIVLCGDFVPTAATLPAFENCNTEQLMGDTLDIVKSADFAIANLECAMTDSNDRIRKCGPNLKGRFEYSKVFAECGFTHMGLSNNHIMDYGIIGFRDTVDSLHTAGIEPFGYGENDQDSRKPLYLEKDGIKTAIIAVCEHEYSYALDDRMGANPFDPFDTMEDIEEAKRNADGVIVMYHGGKEQCQYPSERLRKACRAMIRSGADIVLTQHSHCIGCRESYRNGLIVYGQGNFNFVNYIDNEQWKSGLMVIVNINDTITAELIPVVTESKGIRFADEKEKQVIMTGFEERSRILLDHKRWMKEWEDFCRSPSCSYYLSAPVNAFRNIPEGEMCGQIFPHYLDCEAHLDVWKTLFRTWHTERTSEDSKPRS